MASGVLKYLLYNPGAKWEFPHSQSKALNTTILIMALALKLESLKIGGRNYRVLSRF